MLPAALFQQMVLMLGGGVEEWLRRQHVVAVAAGVFHFLATMPRKEFPHSAFTFLATRVLNRG